MKNNSESTAAVAEAPTAEAYHTPDAAGVFQTYERVIVPGLPVKCAGEVYLAWAERDGQRVFFAGWFLSMRQPVNSTKGLPRVTNEGFPARTEALRWLIDVVVAPFFSDHKAARERVAAWRAKLFPEVVSPVKAAERVVVAAEVPAAVRPLVETVTVVSAAAQIGTAFGIIPVEEIEPNPHNPRTEFDLVELTELADGIAAQGGLLQPIAVRDMGSEAKPRYRLIAGERRWRAHQLLKWEMIEAKVFTGVDDARAGEMALIENLQRAQLNPMEEARGFVELRDRYGYDVDKIHERTGKAESTIRHAFRIAALPEAVCAHVRARRLPVHAAKVLAAARWAQRPAHCAALAEWIVAQDISRAEIDAGLVDTLGTGAAEALARAKLAVEITAYRDQIPAETYRDRKEREVGSEIMEDRTGRLWHLAPAQWKQEKAALDEAKVKKEQAEAERAAKRVKVAITEKVNVRTDDLARAHLNYVSLMGDQARYEPHLPAELVADGVDAAEQEITVCLKPAALKALIAREEELLAADVAAKLPELLARTLAAVKRIKKIGSRELAFIIDSELRGNTGAQWTALDGKAFSDLGLTPPEDLTRSSLASMEPLDLVRVVILSTIYNAKHGELYGALRWVLGIDDLGLAEEREDRREAILKAAAAEVFPPTEKDPKRLGEWQKAHALGMPVAEIARSYRVAEADVRGALGLTE